MISENKLIDWIINELDISQVEDSGDSSNIYFIKGFNDCKNKILDKITDMKIEEKGKRNIQKMLKK